MSKKTAISLFFAGLLVLAGASGFLLWRTPEGLRPNLFRGRITFNKDIAPIVFENCATCHRPNQSAPFDLLTYADARKHAKEIVEVTRRRSMPPWLPEPSEIPFVGERRLTPRQIALIERWVNEGMNEGNAADLPRLPKWNDTWQLGTPDVVVQLPAPYLLAAEGKDVYRNFVVSLPLSARRYVRAVEFRPNSKAVHHAFLRFDRTGESRRLDAEDAEVGFPGIHTPPSAQSPPSQFLSWQPGRQASVSSDDLVWSVETNTDVILQVHMQPNGKVEPVQPSVAFYFAERPGTSIAMKIGLSSYDIDIAPGAKDYLVRDSYTLPVEAELRALLPHAHYLAREMKGEAILPDGTRRSLVHIKDWDFNWQTDYRLTTPLRLPKGTTLRMEYSLDNTEGNPRNPNHPPKRVQYGLQSTDEMAELWLQLVLRSDADLTTLNADLQPRFVRDTIAFNRYVLRNDPTNARAHKELGFAMLLLGRDDEGMQLLRKAIQLKPDYDEPHYLLGLIARRGGQLALAKSEFGEAIRLNPKHGKAHGNLGFVLLQENNLSEAELHLAAAVEINSEDQLARDALREIRAARQRR